MAATAVIKGMEHLGDGSPVCTASALDAAGGHVLLCGLDSRPRVCERQRLQHKSRLTLNTTFRAVQIEIASAAGLAVLATHAKGTGPFWSLRGLRIYHST